MINVVFFKRGNALCGFNVQGHSGYAEAGYDIICSAVSSLTQTALLGLIELVQPKMDYCIGEEGLLTLTILPETDEDEYVSQRTRLILDVVRLGLTNIQNNYGEYLSITEREVT